MLTPVDVDNVFSNVGDEYVYNPEPKMDNIARSRNYTEYERFYRGTKPRPFVCHKRDEELMKNFNLFLKQMQILVLILWKV